MTETKTSKKLSFRRLLPLLIIAAVAIAGFFLLRDQLSFEALRDNREALIAFRDQNYLLAVLAFVGVYVVIVSFSLPGAGVASLTGGFLFSLFPGVVFNIVGATIGASVIFLVARYGLGAQLSARLDASEGTVKQFKEGLRENELSFLFLMRLVPAVPFFLANLIPAMVGVRFDRFVVTTFLGIMPGGFVLTWIGSGLGEVFASGETPDLSVFFEPYILGPVLGLCALALLPVILKRFKKKAG